MTAPAVLGLPRPTLELDGGAELARDSVLGELRGGPALHSTGSLRREVLNPRLLVSLRRPLLHGHTLRRRPQGSQIRAYFWGWYSTATLAKLSVTPPLTVLASFVVRSFVVIFFVARFFMGPSSEEWLGILAGERASGVPRPRSAISARFRSRSAMAEGAPPGRARRAAGRMPEADVDHASPRGYVFYAYPLDGRWNALIWAKRWIDLRGIV